MKTYKKIILIAAVILLGAALSLAALTYFEPAGKSSTTPDSKTDTIDNSPQSHVDTAKTLAEAGRTQDAIAELEKAKELYQKAQNDAEVEAVSQKIQALKQQFPPVVDTPQQEATVPTYEAPAQQ